MDGLSADSDASENFHSKLADFLNNSEEILMHVRIYWMTSLSHHFITDVFITDEVVEESLLKLYR